jgi:hypothetical protein
MLATLSRRGFGDLLAFPSSSIALITSGFEMDSRATFSISTFCWPENSSAAASRSEGGQPAAAR